MGRRARDTRRTARLQRASLTATNPGPGVAFAEFSSQQDDLFNCELVRSGARRVPFPTRVAGHAQQSSQDGARRGGLVRRGRWGEWKSKQ
jgi:hypothetical protein